jgi:hypothetical protein
VKFRNHDKIWTVGAIGHVAKDRHFADWKVKGMGFPNLSNSRHAKSRNEMRNHEIHFGDREMKCEMIEASPAKLRNFSAKLFFGVSGIATWSVKISHHKNCRNREMSKCEMKLQHGVLGIATWSFRNSQHAKSRNAERDYCESRRLEGKNVEIPSVVRLGKEGIRL